MKIEIACDENATFAMSIVVRSLDFEPKSKTFSMRVVMGDDWLGQKLNSPIDAVPIAVNFEQAIGRIQFKYYKDAAAFGAWLIEADAQVEQGFRTMRG